MVVAPGGAAEAPAWHECIDWCDRWATVEATELPAGVASSRFRAGGPDESGRERGVAGSAEQQCLRAGNPIFDSLFALPQSVADSEAQVTDAQFNDGRPIPCPSFETGAQWHYVSTHDISHTVGFGLFDRDPVRPELAALQAVGTAWRAGPRRDRRRVQRLLPRGFARYTGGRGGRDASRSRADIATAQIDAVERPRLVGDQAPRSRAERSSPGTL